MAKQKQDAQLEHTYSSYVGIRDVFLKTWQRQWMIGRSGERGPRISVLAAWHDDDDDEYSETHPLTKDSSIDDVLREKRFDAIAFTLVWRHHMDSDETLCEIAWWKLYKDASCCLNKSWEKHPTKQELCMYLPFILKRRARDGENRWRNKDKTISNVLLCMPRLKFTLIKSLRKLGVV